MNGFIKEKNGFKFLGGRIAQRAYYDCLRDTAHLSPKNNHLKNPLRFAKKDYEDIENSKFAFISDQRIKKITIEILKTNYNITIPTK